jgi:hypothetical protein
MNIIKKIFESWLRIKRKWSFFEIFEDKFCTILLEYRLKFEREGISIWWENLLYFKGIKSEKFFNLNLKEYFFRSEDLLQNEEEYRPISLKNCYKMK